MKIKTDWIYCLLSIGLLITAVHVTQSRAGTSQPSDCHLTSQAAYQAITTPGLKVQPEDRPFIDLAGWLYHHAKGHRPTFYRWYVTLCKAGQAPKGYRVSDGVLELIGDTRGSI